MLLATAAALRRVAVAAAASASAEATTKTLMPSTRIGRRLLASLSPSSSPPTPPSTPPRPPPPPPSASHDPSLHVQLEPISNGPDDIEGVFTLTLCRPSARNAIGKKLLSELRGCLEALAGESAASARALVVRSAVPGVFCAGADLRERAAMTRLEARRFVEELRATVGLLEALPFPTIAAVDGAALGGGAELALAADVRVVGPRASFGFPETRLGIIPGAGGTHRLPRAVGLARAKELILSCRRVAAEEALSIGLAEFGAVPSSSEEEKGGESSNRGENAFSYSSTLLDASAPHGAADAAALALARNMALAAPLAARAAKAAVAGAAAENAAAAPAAGRLEAACYFPLLSTWDRDEGLRAFAEKRPPRFRGE